MGLMDALFGERDYEPEPEYGHPQEPPPEVEETCRGCGGEGTLECDTCEGAGVDDDGETCDECTGIGHEECEQCDGEGTVLV